MRTIHADLIDAQDSGAANPYIYLVINGTNYSSRLIALEHTENPYRDFATIVLANSDHHFDSNDLRGKDFTVGYGYVTASGNKYCGDGAGSEATPTLWVKSQSMVSMEGELICILECEGGWMKLREFNFITTADPPYFNIPFTATDTVFELIEKALEEAGFTLNAIGTQSDSIVNVFQPIFTANPLAYDSPASIIRRLIEMTKCYVREVESLAFEIIFPQTDDSVNITYYNNQVPYFKEYVEKLNLLIPNSIAVFCNRDSAGELVDGVTVYWNTSEHPLITGTALDQNAIDSYTEVIEYHIAPYISNQTDADNRAESILTRYQAETMSGRLLLPFHDCRVEMYDNISVSDKRGS